MNEFLWLYGGDPVEMLEFLLRKDRASARKLRLFRCACVRDKGREDEAGMIERFADGVTTAADHATNPAEQWASTEDVRRWAMQLCTLQKDAHEERLRRCALLRELFGNPFQPLRLDGAWLRWNDGAVARMARAIYDEGRCADLPILADALEEAGCDDALLLHHCRAGGEHVRGCWVVDLLLGKA